MWGIILKYVKVVFILEWVFFCLVDDNEIIYLINIFFFFVVSDKYFVCIFYGY